ncbi:MAG: thioredoxin family protein [Gemmataceae bacterium]|nr:thioredoxin family protein [Gemmataceae bacterium]
MSKHACRLVRLLTVAVVALVVTGALRPSAGQESDDPFARENRAKPKLGLFSRELPNVISFSVRAEPPKARPGEVVRVTITGQLKPGYYTYPLTKRTNEQSEGSLAKLRFEDNLDLQLLWPVQESEPEIVLNDLGEIVLEHKKDFTWSQDFLVFPDAKPGKKVFDVFITLQVCKNICIGPDLFPPFEAEFEVVPEAAVAVPKEIQERQGLKQPPIAVIAPSAEVVAKLRTQAPLPNPPPKAVGSAPAQPTVQGPQDFWGLLGAAFGGAILMLLTPCVFPMIPITVNFFLKQSEKEHHNPMLMASVYSGTIVVMLMLAMFALGSVVIAWANNAWFNIAFGVLLIVFALSLFGMYEIELPSFLARFTSAREGQGGLIGAVFMAMTFTITSFTCTGPFLGLMLAPFGVLKPPLIQLILAALVYSATFAAPFFFLALFPNLLRKLPKSGGWLNTVKVTMGFLEVGAALKFLSIADYEFFPGNPRFFTYDAVICGWIALSFACGLYLFGVFRLPHDDPPEHVGVMRMIFATLFVGFAIYMLPALFGGKPTGVVGENLVAFAPLRLDEGSPLHGGGKGAERLAWTRNYDAAWNDAAKNKKLLFLDFTGQNCQNCRFNENNVFPRQDVHAELKKYVLVQLYTDTVPDPSLAPGEAKRLAERYAEWCKTLTQGVALPTYVILEPTDSKPFDENGNPTGKVRDTRTGQVFNVPDFLQFLRRPLQSQVAQAQPAGSLAPK